MYVTIGTTLIFLSLSLSSAFCLSPIPFQTFHV